MPIKNQTIADYLHQLASKQATPGGGSVSALMGAQAASLISMVCHLSLAQPNADLQKLRKIMHRAEELRQQLTDLIAADIAAFDSLMACYRLPKTSPAQKTERSRKIQCALREATIVPMQCASASAEIIDLSAAVQTHANPNVISDAGVATIAAYAAIKAAALNVYTNTSSCQDQEFCDTQLASLAKITASAEKITNAVYQLVLDSVA